MARKDYDQRSMDKVQMEDKVRKCPDCGSEDIDYVKGELYCKKCGLVID